MFNSIKTVLNEDTTDFHGIIFFNFAEYFSRSTHELLHFYIWMFRVCIFFLLNLVLMLRVISVNFFLSSVRDI